MTNREKWMSEVISDRLIENSICCNCMDIEAGFGNCPKCPISLRTLFKKRFVDNVPTDPEYMAAVSKWLDEEDKDD